MGHELLFPPLMPGDFLPVRFDLCRCFSCRVTACGMDNSAFLHLKTRLQVKWRRDAFGTRLSESIPCA
jgi:hypothetical protein